MRPPLSPHHKYVPANTPELLWGARILHGSTYKDRGYVEELDENGMVQDPYVGYSSYSVAVNLNHVDAAVRRIAKNPFGFPALTQFQLYPDWMKYAPGLTQDNTEEISALAADKSAYGEIFSLGPGLYRFMWQEARRKGKIRYWVASIDAGLYKYFRNVYHFCFEQIGEARVYMGSLTVPAVLDLERVPAYMHYRDAELYQFFAEGLEPEFLPIIPGDTPAARSSTFAA